ncbi:MAG: adenosine deaminase [Planctomycetota bacterium]
MSGHLVDLHRHLDGSLRASTVEELARERQRYVPRRLKFTRGMGLDEALSRFGFLLSLLQEPAAVRRVAAEICEDAAQEGVSVLELRFAPQLHRAAPLEEVVDAALEGAAGRAGIILCGLYGEPPELLGRLVEAAATRPGVVGLDLAGGPSPTQRWILEDYARPFRRAAELGLGRTVHASEGRPPEEIAIAIEVLGAQRIGHGTTLLEDPAVLDLVVERGVTLEACLSSNEHTGAIERVSEHPLPQWLRAGVKVCLCTDNTFLSDTTLPRERDLARRIKGMNEELLARTLEHGRAAAFRRA